MKKMFGIETDVIDVTLKNDGGAYIWTETKEYETSYSDGESWVVNAPKYGFVKADEHHYSNGDVRYWFH